MEGEDGAVCGTCVFFSDERGGRCAARERKGRVKADAEACALSYEPQDTQEAWSGFTDLEMLDFL